MRAINHTWEQCRQRGKNFPYEPLGTHMALSWGLLKLRLWLQADNCPREVRNQFTAKWAISMVQAGYFTNISQNFLEKGHTHEDVGLKDVFLSCMLFLMPPDACLSVVRTCLASTPVLETPRDIQRSDALSM